MSEKTKGRDDFIEKKFSEFNNKETPTKERRAKLKDFIGKYYDAQKQFRNLKKELDSSSDRLMEILDERRDLEKVNEQLERELQDIKLSDAFKTFEEDKKDQEELDEILDSIPDDEDEEDEKVEKAEKVEKLVITEDDDDEDEEDEYVEIDGVAYIIFDKEVVDVKTGRIVGMLSDDKKSFERQTPKGKKLHERNIKNLKK